MAWGGSISFEVSNSDDTNQTYIKSWPKLDAC